MKIGYSRDIHKLVFLEDKTNDLILGGICIPNTNYYVVANSNGDVVVHALVEAVFGALCCGDLGSHFQQTMKKNSTMWRAFSNYMLEYANKLIIKNNHLINNIDIMIVFDHIMLKDYVLKMREFIAKHFFCNLNQISIKCTRSEGMSLGYIEATAVALLKEKYE